jgi:hypothetical protein
VICFTEKGFFLILKHKKFPLDFSLKHYTNFTQKGKAFVERDTGSWEIIDFSPAMYYD